MNLQDNVCVSQSVQTLRRQSNSPPSNLSPRLVVQLICVLSFRNKIRIGNLGSALTIFIFIDCHFLFQSQQQYWSRKFFYHQYTDKSGLSVSWSLTFLKNYLENFKLSLETQQSQVIEEIQFYWIRKNGIINNLILVIIMVHYFSRSFKECYSNHQKLI